jgi:hypothetical protein
MLLNTWTLAIIELIYLTAWYIALLDEERRIK